MFDSVVTREIVARTIQELEAAGAVRSFLQKLRRTEPALYNLLDEQRAEVNRMLVAHRISAGTRQEIEKKLMLMTSAVSKVWSWSLAVLWADCEPLAAWAGRENGGGK